MLLLPNYCNYLDRSLEGCIFFSFAEYSVPFVWNMKPAGGGLFERQMIICFECDSKGAASSKNLQHFFYITIFFLQNARRNKKSTPHGPVPYPPPPKPAAVPHATLHAAPPATPGYTALAALYKPAERQSQAVASMGRRQRATAWSKAYGDRGVMRGVSSVGNRSSRT